MELKFWLCLITALLPVLTGFVWYHPRVFGNRWMKEAGIDPAAGANFNFLLVTGLTYFFGLLLSVGLLSNVIHQMHLYSVLASTPGFGEEGSATMNLINDFMAEHGNNFRTFKHGVLHGTIAGVFIILPGMAVNALYESRSWRYTAISAGFWILNAALIGGVLSALA